MDRVMEQQAEMQQVVVSFSSKLFKKALPIIQEDKLLGAKGRIQGGKDGEGIYSVALEVTAQRAKEIAEQGRGILSIGSPVQHTILVYPTKKADQVSAAIGDLEVMRVATLGRGGEQIVRAQVSPLSPTQKTQLKGTGLFCSVS